MGSRERVGLRRDTVLMLLLSLLKPLHAEEKYTELKQGEPAPYAGVLLTKEAIAKIYELTNFLAKKDISIERKIYGIRFLALLMEPFTPHLAQEIWVTIGENGFVAEAEWPEVNEQDSEKNETIILPIQINGKRKTEISVAPDLSEEALKVNSK